GFTPLSAQMQLQWMLLEDAVASGVAEMLMRDVPEAVEVYDDNSEEEEQGVVACPWTEQAEAAELEAAANILHDFVEEDPIVEQPDDD
ncbi:unnamed protein product, partial [Effrenium voratum]